MSMFNSSLEDNYIGVWAGQPWRELHIRKLKAQHYLATLLIKGQANTRLNRSGESDSI